MRPLLVFLLFALPAFSQFLDHNYTVVVERDGSAFMSRVQSLAYFDPSVDREALKSACEQTEGCKIEGDALFITVKQSKGTHYLLEKRDRLFWIEYRYEQKALPLELFSEKMNQLYARLGRPPAFSSPPLELGKRFDVGDVKIYYKITLPDGSSYTYDLSQTLKRGDTLSAQTSVLNTVALAFVVGAVLLGALALVFLKTK